jgi:hypothetical protein
LPAPGTPRDKANNFLARTTSPIDQRLEPSSGVGEIGRICLGTDDLGDIVMRVQMSRSLDDRWGGAVAPRKPRAGFDWFRKVTSEFVEQRGHLMRRERYRLPNTVRRVRRRVRLASGAARRNQDGDDRHLVAGLVKVLGVQRVLPYLRERMLRNRRLTDLEL